VDSVLIFAGLVGFIVGIVGLFRSIGWARISNRKQAGIVIGVSIVVMMIGGALAPSDEDLAASEPVDVATTQPEVASADSGTAETTVTDDPSTASASSPTSTTVATTTSTEEAAPSVPQYTILDEEDVSFAGAIRISLRVTVEEGADREGLRRVAEEISETYRESHGYQALNIFFYHYPEVAFDTVTLGVWDDSPYGDWSRAADVKRGDYSHHEPSDKTKEKNWSLLPSQTEATLYAAYNSVYYALAESSAELPTDDQIIALVAAEEGVSEVAVEEAFDRFFTWIFNDES
jgi:hypothetical protein